MSKRTTARGKWFYFNRLIVTVEEREKGGLFLLRELLFLFSFLMLLISKTDAADFIALILKNNLYASFFISIIQVLSFIAKLPGQLKVTNLGGYQNYLD